MYAFLNKGWDLKSLCRDAFSDLDTKLRCKNKMKIAYAMAQWPILKYKEIGSYHTPVSGL